MIISFFTFSLHTPILYPAHVCLPVPLASQRGTKRRRAATSRSGPARLRPRPFARGGMHPARQLAGSQQPSPVPGPFLFLGSMWGSVALVFSASPIIIFFEVYLEKSCLTRGRQPKQRPRQPSISSRTAPGSSSVHYHLTPPISAPLSLSLYPTITCV